LLDFADLNVAEVLIALLLQPPAHDYPHVQPFLEFLSQVPGLVAALAGLGLAEPDLMK
jgi:hypothetical protein